VGVVLDAELVRDGEEQGVGRLDRRVLGQLPDEDVGLRGIGSPEDRLRLRVDVADLVLILTTPAEVRPITIVDERKDRPADRDPRLARVAGRGPRVAEQADLLRLELMERLARVLGHRRRRHQVQSLLGRPLGGRA
jgi:hypothetical protein